MITVHLDADGKLALPQGVLELLDLEPGDEIVIDISDGRVILSRAPRPGDEEEEAMVQAAIDEYLSKPQGPTYSVEDVRAHLQAHIQASARKRDAA
jgi:bifunctional DNA-binding transcriptional regulator/antitoxin component of YhaV-PrlF toxin-antitoxin module